MCYSKTSSVRDFIIHLLFGLTGYTIATMTFKFFLFFDISCLNISCCQKLLDAIVFLFLVICFPEICNALLYLYQSTAERRDQ